VDASKSTLNKERFMGGSSSYIVVAGLHKLFWDIRKVNLVAFCCKGVIAL
jgi:hypothetical protein